MNRILKLIPLVTPYYKSDDPAHDWAHVKRVASNAENICKNLGIESELILAAVYCHDLVNLPKDHPDRKNASMLSAETAEGILTESSFNNTEITLIKKAIVEHSFSKGSKASCIEAAVVQDADRLDALGAIGVLRCAAVNAKMGSAFYHMEDPLAQTRILDDKTYMLDHYFVKLFKLPDLMNTDAARDIALHRVGFMKQFIEEMILETRP